MPKVIKGARAEWGTCSRIVSLDRCIWSLSYWNSTIAVGSGNRDIIILDAITGSQMAVLSGHTDEVNCVTFSSDGRSLASGSDDETIKLWDVQTGGVVKTFHGHTQRVWSVSISADCTRIASGSEDNTIYLWDIQTGKCHCTIQQQDTVHYVSFSPINPSHLISVSGSKIWEWDVNGNQISPAYDGSHITFSPDHTQFALCNRNDITVQNSNSREIVVKFCVADAKTAYCCFSPDGRLVAAAAGHTAYVWDLTSPDPSLFETFIGHTDDIRSLMFSSPSSLISASEDESVRFWKIGSLLLDLVTTNSQLTSLASAEILSVSLQTRDRIAISSDGDGVVKTWDLSTGICKESFKIPAAKDQGYRDAQLIDGRVIFVWEEDNKIHVWDTEKDEILQTLDAHLSYGLRISGDGSKIISLGERSIQVWSMWTWEFVGEVELGLEGRLYLDCLYTDSSRVWIYSKSSSAQEGWDFGVSGSSPVQFDPSIGRPHLDYIGGTSWQTDGPYWIKDMATRKEVFQFSGRYAEPYEVQWDGQYLVAGYESGEVLILDFHDVSSRDV